MADRVRVLRTAIIVIIAILIVCSFVMMGYGFYHYVNRGVEIIVSLGEVDLSDNVVQVAVLGMGLLGVVLFVTSLFGLSGAILENKCCLTMYVILISLLLLLQIANGVLARMCYSAISTIEAPQLKGKLQRYFNKKKPFTNAVKEMQYQYECCGIYGPGDYEEIPQTCCVLKVKGRGVWENPSPRDWKKCQNKDAGFIHNKGCYDFVISQWKKDSIAIMAIAFTVLFLEAIGMFLGFFLCGCLCLG